MISYFIDALKLISNREEVPYYLDSKTRDLGSGLSYKNIGDLLHLIVSNENASGCFRYLNRNWVLEHMFPYLHNLKFVPQNKGKSKNAFEHTIKVVDTVPVDDIDLRWVALFHDLGKYDSYTRDGNFKRHQIYSYDMSEYLCKLYDIQNSDKICSIVKNHMFPLDYQRNPNWTEKAIRRFIDRCTKEYVIDTIEFAYYDKKSENNVPEYLKIIEDLREKVLKILNEEET